MGKSTVFFVSTGRCATQWFADNLARHYNDLAVVSHEPLGIDYQARRYFNAYHKSIEVELSSAIKSHLKFIRSVVREKHYIETGWAVYGALPFIQHQLGNQVKVVHLYRHPVKVAASLTTHNVYRRGAWTEALAISPSDSGVTQTHLEGYRWDAATDYEKCLFWWTEINNYALKMQKQFEKHSWLQLKFEDVFSRHGTNELMRLIDFLQLPKRAAFFNSRDRVTDAYSATTSKSIDVLTIEKYSKTLEIMQQLGYELDRTAISSTKKRYEMSNLQRLMSTSRRLKNLLAAFGIGRKGCR